MTSLDLDPGLDVTGAGNASLARGSAGVVSGRLAGQGATRNHGI